jgi:hypothetical protein
MTKSTEGSVQDPELMETTDQPGPQELRFHAQRPNFSPQLHCSSSADRSCPRDKSSRCSIQKENTYASNDSRRQFARNLNQRLHR